MDIQWGPVLPTADNLHALLTAWDALDQVVPDGPGPTAADLAQSAILTGLAMWQDHAQAVELAQLHDAVADRLGMGDLLALTIAQLDPRAA